MQRQYGSVSFLIVERDHVEDEFFVLKGDLFDADFSFMIVEEVLYFENGLEGFGTEY